MEVDVLDQHPDIHELFCYYNALYFEDILGACLVTSHGNEFQNLMKKINCSTVVDYQRPPAGYGITIYHNLFDEVDSYRVHHWMCNNCGDLVKRAMNREPSPNDCVQRLKEDQVCNNPSCHWHR
ncbi:hypothetical protein EJ110_NYTH37098 [Nymphaea thermarum]|nr:hypothetical protein EJ110_NYTH37098 [Nymphaea thermarum]